ncbi:2585_t:CDS:2 [Funneliformis geosporum]|uniref:6597_t:CDS:1 n=1 Tax=Funneliformis geosporum TaxID=1117311 RepID=A0A9W4SV38_9GLOM|nr:2585_t:CDS:2 [Funneliformis geosporum]CAI2180226.1 6597_t:CDS:2 [Funneliformis geosporum]
MSTSKQNKSLKTSIIKDLVPQQNHEFQQIIQPKKSIKIIRSGKVKKYIENALSIFQDEKSRETVENVIVVFSGKGQAINKTITVVEIIKRKLDGSLHQYTQIGRNFLTNEYKEKDQGYEMNLDYVDQKGQDGQVHNTVEICSFKI